MPQEVLCCVSSCVLDELTGVSVCLQAETEAAGRETLRRGSSNISMNI